MIETHTPGRGAAHQRLDVRVNELRQFFNSIDAAPFRERDLDPNAEAFIVDWARETRSGVPLAMTVHVTGGRVTEGEPAMLQQAVHDYFEGRAAEARRRLRQLFRTGRWSLAVGIAFVGLAIVIGDVVGGLVGPDHYGRLIEDSVIIGAWVALWRPIEIFLYDWWPIRAEARLFDRLSAMPVDLVEG